MHACLLVGCTPCLKEWVSRNMARESISDLTGTIEEPRNARPIGVLFSRQKVPLPLVIGVVGHRDLRPEDGPRLSETVSKILGDLKKEWESGKSESGPIMLLCGLAKGADQLVARVAVNKGIRLVAILPMSRELYERDFTGDVEALKQFRVLWNKAHAHVELPLCEGSTQSDVSIPGLSRDRQYEQLGVYIVQHSYILIALWDGVSIKATGGTSQVVNMKLNNCVSHPTVERNLLDVPTVGPVFQIVTPRLDNQTPPNAFCIRVYWPDNEFGKAPDLQLLAYDPIAHQVLQRLKTYNRDWLKLRSKLKSKLKSSQESVLPPSQYSSEAEFLLSQFAVADTMAGYFKQWMDHTVIQYLILLLIAGLLLSMIFYFYPLSSSCEPANQSGISDRLMLLLRNPENYLGTSPYLIIAYGLTMCAIYGVYAMAKKADYHNKYHDYRALAEGLRVQVYWHLAGINKSAADYYLHHQISELDWIRCAIKSLCLRVSHKTPDAMPSFVVINQSWVARQLEYFESAEKYNARRAQRLQAGAILAFWIAVPWGVLKVLGGTIDWIVAPNLSDKWAMQRIVLSIVLVLLSTASTVMVGLVGYSHLRGFAEQAKRYSKMKPLFARARRFLDAAQRSVSNPEVAGNEVVHSGKAQCPVVESLKPHDILIELGQQALAENADWLVMHHRRKLNLPH